MKAQLAEGHMVELSAIDQFLPTGGEGGRDRGRGKS